MTINSTTEINFSSITIHDAMEYEQSIQSRRKLLLRKLYTEYMAAPSTSISFTYSKNNKDTIKDFFYLLDKEYLVQTSLDQIHSIDFRLSADGLEYVEKYLLVA